MITLSVISLLIFPFPISGTRPGPFLKSSQNSRREICSRQFALGKSGKNIIFWRPAPFSRKSEISGNKGKSEISRLSEIKLNSICYFISEIDAAPPT